MSDQSPPDCPSPPATAQPSTHNQPVSDNRWTLGKPLPVGYRFPWRILASASLSEDAVWSDSIECTFSRASILDNDLQKKSEARSVERVVAENLDRMELVEEKEAKPGRQPPMTKDVLKCLPRTFGNKKAKKNRGATLLLTSDGAGKYSDTVEFDQFYEDFQVRFVYGQWLAEFGEEMAEEDREELTKTVDAAPEDTVLKIPPEAFRGITRSHSTYASLSTYNEVFALNCQLVEEVVRKHFEIFAAKRRVRKCADFLDKVKGLGFVPGYKSEEIEASAAEKTVETTEEHNGGGDEASPSTASAAEAPPAKVNQKSHKRQMTNLAEGLFADVYYEIYDPHLSTQAPVLAEERKADEEEEDGEVEDGENEAQASSTSAVTKETEAAVEKEPLRFSFDPAKDGHLVAAAARDTYKDDPEIKKYWFQRYRLFTRLDQGILMDREGWFSVTPERIAQHIADRVVQHTGAVVVDAFAGVGGNTIQMALRGAYVLAVDLDPVRLRCARENARVYGVEQRVDFILADFFSVAEAWKREGRKEVDAVFLSPPWGGPAYLASKEFDLTKDMTPDGVKIFEAAREMSPNIAYFLPRHTSVKQIISLSKNTGGKVDIEQACLNKKIKVVTAYYGELANA